MGLQKATPRTLLRFYRAAIKNNEYGLSRVIKDELVRRLEVAGS